LIWSHPQPHIASILHPASSNKLFLSIILLYFALHSGKHFGTPKPWAKSDRPIDVRTAEGALLGIKRMLVSWGYTKSAVRVNTDTCTLSVCGTQVAKASVVDYMLKLEWCDGQWEQWQDLQSSGDLADLKGGAQEKLNKAKNAASVAGKGKGKTFE
jgi:hypothetical protein